ncbi:hypothetical protein SLA2020_270300 [Shorea laevis]
MFEGTVRSNLDPLEEFTDQQIWEALDKCQLGDEVRKKEKNLILQLVRMERIGVWVRGSLSALAVCYSREQTLKQHFYNCTVITIAHRITSILDSDMVLLLNNGLIEEYDLQQDC